MYTLINRFSIGAEDYPVLGNFFPNSNKLRSSAKSKFQDIWMDSFYVGTAEKG